MIIMVAQLTIQHGKEEKVRALFEEFNYTLLEDESAWKRVVDKCHEIRKKYPEGKLIEIALSDAAYELEKIAKKRGRRYE